MNPIVLDTETTIYQKGHPFAQRNKLCYIGAKSGVLSDAIPVEFNSQPYGGKLQRLQVSLSNYDCFVAFNWKFDAHWLRRYGIDFKHMQVWDLQLAEFIITGQEQRMPGLDATCARVGIKGKVGDIAEKYWNQGIDTPDIPEQELVDYVNQDCQSEWELYEWQMEYLRTRPKLYRIIYNACQDLIITQEMEYNGLCYDLAFSEEIGDKYLAQIAVLDEELAATYGRRDISWNSNDALSCVLYGGVFKYESREPFTFTYKDGRTKEKLRWVNHEEVFERLVEPLPNTELKKRGYYEVNEGVLSKLKAAGKAKKIISLMLERNAIEKKVGTYFHGIPKLYQEMDWQDNVVHGQLNHAVARTGRLSSSKPNQQNLDKEVRLCIKSRFPKQTTSK